MWTNIEITAARKKVSLLCYKSYLFYTVGTFGECLRDYFNVCYIFISLADCCLKTHTVLIISHTLKCCMLLCRQCYSGCNWVAGTQLQTQQRILTGHCLKYSGFHKRDPYTVSLVWFFSE